MIPHRLWVLGWLLVILGTLIVMAAPLILILASLHSSAPGEAAVGVGGCVVVVFVPICFGAGTEGLGEVALLAAVLLAAVVIAVFALQAYLARHHSPTAPG